MARISILAQGNIPQCKCATFFVFTVSRQGSWLTCNLGLLWIVLQKAWGHLGLQRSVWTIAYVTSARELGFLPFFYWSIFIWCHSYIPTNSLHILVYPCSCWPFWPWPFSWVFGHVSLCPNIFGLLCSWAKWVLHLLDSWTICVILGNCSVNPAWFSQAEVKMYQTYPLLSPGSSFLHSLQTTCVTSSLQVLTTEQDILEVGPCIDLHEISRTTWLLLLFPYALESFPYFGTW